jgi:hypothetical protein
VQGLPSNQRRRPKREAAATPTLELGPSANIRFSKHPDQFGTRGKTRKPCDNACSNTMCYPWIIPGWLLEIMEQPDLVTSRHHCFPMVSGP